MDKVSAPKQQGFAHIFVILLLLAGLGAGVYLVQHKTNILPKASAPAPAPSFPPVLYWKLDDGSGTVAADSSGSGLNGTLLGGPSWTVGKIGGGLSFDGIDDVVRAGDDPRLNTTDSETIEFWANLKSASRFRTILTKGFAAPFPYRFEFFSDTRLQFIIHDGLKPGPAAVATTNIVGNWHHIAGVRDTAAKKLYIYIDGVLEGTAVDTTTASTGNSGNLILGGRLPVTGGTSTEKVRVAEAKDFVISGVIDDVRIYNYARTADQIKQDTMPSFSRVFVTSTLYNGNLGGLAGADAKCQDRANTASLGGTWKAWLSYASDSPDSRFTHSALSYKGIDGVVIANDWNDLIDGTIQNGISISELGKSVVDPAGSSVWTNTYWTGISLGSSSTCSGFTSTSSYVTSFGMVGSTNVWWTDISGSASCANGLRLYCFEQITGPTVPTSTPKPTLSPTPTPTSTPTPTPTPQPTLSPTPTPTPIASILPPSSAYKRVFKTSSYYYNGNLLFTADQLPGTIVDTGLAAGDKICQYSADSNNLSGRWQAWLSDSKTSVAQRFITRAIVPYKTLNGVTVANNWTDLIDGSLQNPINITEFGQKTTDAGAWTNTSPNGNSKYTQTGSTCSDWTTAQGCSIIGGQQYCPFNGSQGEDFKTDSGWTDIISVPCSYSDSLYCFEQ